MLCYKVLKGTASKNILNLKYGRKLSKIKIICNFSCFYSIYDESGHNHQFWLKTCCLLGSKYQSSKALTKYKMHIIFGAFLAFLLHI